MTKETTTITPMEINRSGQKPSTTSTTASVIRTAVVASAATRTKDATDRYAALSARMVASAAAPRRASSKSSPARWRERRERDASAAAITNATRMLANAARMSLVTMAGREASGVR